MVAKKRNQLRTKAALRLNRSEESGPEELADQVSSEDPKAFLHQPRESKKEKKYNKSQSFRSRMQESGSMSTGISKSALRRRKRKLRDDLKPKMQDLLVSLEQEGVVERADDTNQNGSQEQDKHAVTKIISFDSYSTLKSSIPEYGSVAVKKNQPNIRNQRGAKVLAQTERDRFSAVLRNQQFQQNPFAALKEVIKMQK